MDLSSLPCEFQVWFGNWIIANCDDDSERNIEFFDKMESMPMRLCLVTVGATASFERLIRQVLNEQFFAQLAKYHYTHLLVQYGKDGEAIWNDFQVQFPRGCEKLHGIAVAGFDFRPNLWQYMRLATNDHNQELGIVISHAGTGTILDALRLALPLIIVPNPDLADNHQEDLAFEMEEMKYAIHADSENLIKALDTAEAHPPQRLSRPHGPDDALAGLITDQLQDVD
ncbi:uncharacterized protein N7469_007987 [Penicillium citrinum]|uniref:UDP-N-acetylglucosamine transferase subunit ALG13 n=1 Tax=Penicillium citrinum TaxID=5077 RepID=A0A9W9NTS0_PENCI|nr:uncharacterized protein N7469_007987 [Penicillium citrinum]KAJ5224484.1 hypothetical protein N7469_007987 [Penicillium citrinum]